MRIAASPSELILEQKRRAAVAALIGSALFTLFCATAVLAARSGDTPDAQARFRIERAACLEGRTNQDRATCLREAGAALQEARRGRLEDDQAAFDQNRVLRCNPLPPEEKQDCIRRMNGEGIVRGSVEEGGIYRELRTIVPANPAPPAR